MNTQFEYYYNNVPGKGLCRNNLIYTSLISKDRKTFCQWYYNDENYHSGHNEVVDPRLMEEKWHREIKFLTIMARHYPQHVPTIDTVDHINKKIYFDIDGTDFWEQAQCSQNNYDNVVDGKLKSINYFFAYDKNDKTISLTDVMSHISINRRNDLLPKMTRLGIDVDKPTSFFDIQMLAFESFKTDFPADAMDEACSIYKHTTTI